MNQDYSKDFEIVDGVLKKYIGHEKEVVIPYGVKRIGADCFKGLGNKSLGVKNISIPDSVMSIGKSAFAGCDGLTSITIPNSVTSIDEEAFMGCTNLVNVQISDSVTYIGSYAFLFCVNLATVKLSASMTSIEENTFSDCYSLSSVTIPDGIASIGYHAFLGCDALDLVTIPDSVIHIDKQAFPEHVSIKKNGADDFDESVNAATDEEMKSEALEQIKFWIENFGLNPKIYDYFQAERLYYSYLTAGGFIGSIDTISYDKKYERLVKEFEDEYDTVVYHCIESKTVFGNSLTMLYVGRDKDEWSEEKPSLDGVVMANVYNLDESFNEIGLVKFEAYQGALVRVM